MVYTTQCLENRNGSPVKTHGEAVMWLREENMGGDIAYCIITRYQLSIPILDRTTTNDTQLLVTRTTPCGYLCELYFKVYFVR